MDQFLSEVISVLSTISRKTKNSCMANDFACFINKMDLPTQERLFLAPYSWLQQTTMPAPTHICKSGERWYVITCATRVQTWLLGFPTKWSTSSSFLPIWSHQILELYAWQPRHWKDQLGSFWDFGVLWKPQNKPKMKYQTLRHVHNCFKNNFNFKFTEISNNVQEVCLKLKLSTVKSYDISTYFCP